MASSFDPSPATNPDVQAFESWKYSHRGLWMMVLPSGNIAVANCQRQLIDIVQPFDLLALAIHLNQASTALAPVQEKVTSEVATSLPPDLDLSDLDLRI